MPIGPFSSPLTPLLLPPPHPLDPGHGSGSGQVSPSTHSQSCFVVPNGIDSPPISGAGVQQGSERGLGAGSRMTLLHEGSSQRTAEDLQSSVENRVDGNGESLDVYKIRIEDFFFFFNT